MNKVEELIRHFNMEPHPEGGFSKLLYEDNELIYEDSFTGTGERPRPLWNSIYYLLPEGSKSIFHRLTMTEMWNFYLGERLELYDLSTDGDLKRIILGPNVLNGEQVSYVVPKGHWMAAKPSENSSYCFVGCITCPGFTFLDWEKGERDELIKSFPVHKDIINELTE